MCSHFGRYINQQIFLSTSIMKPFASLFKSHLLFSNPARSIQVHLEIMLLSHKLLDKPKTPKTKRSRQPSSPVESSPSKAWAGWMGSSPYEYCLLLAIGIILGNFVPNISSTLQKGKFVGVSVLIGELHNQSSSRHDLRRHADCNGP